MSETASTPTPLPPWFAKSELVVLRVFAAVSLVLVAVAVALGLSGSASPETSRAIGLAGVAVMLATPFVRLVLLIAGFLAIRDRLYIALSIAILAVLCAGFLGG